MRNKLILFGGIVILMIINSLQIGFANLSAGQKEILYISSYHSSYLWSEDTLLGIEIGLHDIEDYSNLTIEYMDTKRNSSQANINNFVERMKIKYDADSFDVIIVSDDAAFMLMNKHGDELFGDTPYVFCGVNNSENIDFDRSKPYTGIIESSDYDLTVNIALNLQDDIDYVYYISDTTLTGGLLKNELLSNFETKNKQIEIKRLDGDSLDELIANAQQVEENSIIVLMSFFNINGNYYESKDLYRLLQSVTHVPIYGSQEYYLPAGLTGGYLTSGFTHGNTAAKMAIEILNGKNPTKIEIVKDDHNKLWFNYLMIEQFDIPLENLPTNSKIINHNLFENHNIGIIFSTDGNSLSNLAFEQGISEYLESEGIKFNILKEYLDEEKVNTPGHDFNMYKMIYDKYSGINVETVITFGQPAYHFIKTYNDLTSRANVIYTNIYENQIEGHLDNSVGIIETAERTDNIGLVFDLFPDTKKIIFITDNSKEGLAYKDEFKDYMNVRGYDIPIIFWNDRHMDRIVEEVQHLSKDTVVIFAKYVKDVSNNIFIGMQSVNMIVDYSTAPVFVLDDAYMGSGAIGGKIKSSYKLGQCVGEKIVTQMQSEEKLESKTMYMDHSKYIFDYNVLSKFGVSMLKLPEGSEILNMPISTRAYLNDNPVVRSLLIVALVAIVFVVLILIVYLRFKEKTRQEINYYATTDELTGVYNRRWGYELLSDLIEKSDEEELCFSICYIDINDLKKVNDVLGHIAGDDLIISIFEVVKKHISDKDFVSRFGGDEFVVAFVDKREDDVKKVMSSIVDELDLQNKLHKKQFEMSISYGVVEYCQVEHYELDELIEKADEKMYAYKTAIKVKRL